MKKITIILFILFFGFAAKAQVINVCGTDSVTLTVDNYVNGTIEWQESLDTLTWANIPEVSGITYRFLPTETKYYRAVVKTSDCQPLYSAISLVQLIPIANAGIDRTIGTTSMSLLGNYIPGAVGEWTILSGNGGVIDNNSNPKALLTGLNNETYKLKWTLTNACGQSTDTVQISFNQLVAITNFIVVDNTDSILSDSTQIANGVYRVKFSDPNIAPVDSVILIGIRQDISFLRKVVSFALQDSVYTFTTVQGELTDLFTSGSINIGDAINQGLSAQSTNSQKMKRVSGSLNLNTFPTRKIIETYRNTKDIQILYAPKIEDNAKSPKFAKSIASVDWDEVVKIPIDDQTLFESSDGTFKFGLSDTYINITPHFVSDYELGLNDIFPYVTAKNVKIGLDNAEVEFNVKSTLSASSAIEWNKDDKIVKELLNKRYSFIYTLFGVPVQTTAEFVVKASANFSIGSEISYENTKNIKLNFTALAQASDIRKDLSLYFPKPTLKTTSIDKFTDQATLEGGLNIGPQISFYIYNVVGPYFYLPAKLKASACINYKSNWNAIASIGLGGELGVHWNSKKLDNYNFKYPLFDDAFKTSVEFPYKLELLSGNFQTGQSGNVLTKPIGIKVVSDWGFGVPWVPVSFSTETGNGSTDKTVIYTDFNGEVYPKWTLGSNQQNKLSVQVLDCNDNNIENSPLYVYASTTSQNYNCTNSNLYVSMKSVNGKITPAVTGGVKPYTYSTDGINYSATTPLFDLSVARQDTLLVKDGHGCISSRAFSIPITNSCAGSTLSLNVLTQPNIVTISGKGGISPYQYAMDGSGFSTTATYYKLNAGKHIATVKDAKGCTSSQSFNVASTDTLAAISAFYPADGSSYIPTASIHFAWATGNYTSNQTYDLYLKKGTDAYTLIASNLSSSSYTYSTALLANTKYTWKVTVKKGSSVLDYGEFTFTTASGVATTPTAPLLLQPNNGYITTGLDATLKWTAQTGDFKYDVYLDTNDASTVIALNVTSPEYLVNKLVSGKTYYWKVKIKSTITGASVLSAVRCFSVQQNNNTVTDIDGNVYHTIKIGSQTWMVENLKTSKYRNGEIIANVTDNTAWTGLTTGAWCNSNNDAANGTKFGKLYNWYAVADNRSIAPVGWHVATDAEWTVFQNYLIVNGYNYDGTITDNKIAKSLASVTDWYVASIVGTPGNDLTLNNKSGITALPGGYRDEIGRFTILNSICIWWNLNESSSTLALSKSISVMQTNLLSSGELKNCGFSVRCIKDAPVIIPEISTALIPAGTFTMGSPTTEVNRNINETQHQVTISAFRMSKYEITNAQYATFLNAKGIGSNGLYTTGTYPTQPLIYASSGNFDWGLHYIGGQWMPVLGYENNPVIYVTWYGAAEYATYVGGRLPTEAEWEYACRAGTATPFNTGSCLTNLQANYYWANPYSTCTNTLVNSPGKSQVVGTYSPNGYGLYDMHGNVYEWCSDWYGTYPTAAQTNPTGAATGSYRVFRGGDYISAATWLRSAYRQNDSPAWNYGNLGFRVVFTTTENPQNVTDIDGNVYHTIKIGTQTWMVENLKTTKFRTGEAIPNVTDNTAWENLTTGAWCNYNNDAANGTKYGKLYNWYAVADSRNIAPAGWHVPTDAEWTTLENWVSGNLGISGSIPKALAATTDWISWLSGGSGVDGFIGYDLTKNNNSGFTALPGGYRSNGFTNIGYACSMWSSTENNINTNAWYMGLIWVSSNVNRNYITKSWGYSVRCIKDY